MILKNNKFKYLKKEDWLDVKTRDTLLDKLKFMRATVAYLDEFLDDDKLEKHYRNLELSPVHYLKNMINLFRFNTEKDLKELVEPATTKNWTGYELLSRLSTYTSYGNIMSKLLYKNLPTKTYKFSNF